MCLLLRFCLFLNLLSFLAQVIQWMASFLALAFLHTFLIYSSNCLPYLDVLAKLGKNVASHERVEPCIVLLTIHITLRVSIRVKASILFFVKYDCDVVCKVFTFLDASEQVLKFGLLSVRVRDVNCERSGVIDCGKALMHLISELHVCLGQLIDEL